METPERHCNGGPHGEEWCGQRATVVCTAADQIEWFACDIPAHQEGAKTMPIDDWFRKLVNGSAER
jgi:hypothetical protein